MTLKLAQFCDDPKKISTKSSYSLKIFIFLKTPKNIEIQNLNPKKWAEPTYVWKYQGTPLGCWPSVTVTNTAAVQTYLLV